MTAILTPEETEATIKTLRDEARFRPTIWGEARPLLIVAADTLADLRRQLDEARAALSNMLAIQLREAARADDAEHSLAEERAAYNAVCAKKNDWPTVAQVQIERDEARAECERQRERAEKAEEWSWLRDADIITLGQEVGKWQAAAEGERTRCAEAVYDYDAHHAILALPPPTIEPSVTEKANG